MVLTHVGSLWDVLSLTSCRRRWVCTWPFHRRSTPWLELPWLPQTLALEDDRRSHVKIYGRTTCKINDRKQRVQEQTDKHRLAALTLMHTCINYQSNEYNLEPVRMSQNYFAAINWYLNDTLASTQAHKYSNIGLDQCFAKIGQGELLNIYELPNYSEEILTWHPSYSRMSKQIENRVAWLACIIAWKIRFWWGEEDFMKVKFPWD